MPDEWTLERLIELGRSYEMSQPLLAASELGLFDVVDGTPRSAAAVAERLRSDRRGTTILLDALTALGVLAKSAGRYAVPSSLLPLLAPGSASSVLPAIRHQATCAHRWDRLAETVRSGSPARARAHAGWDEPEQRAFIGAMHVVARGLVDELVAALRPARFRWAIDVGGGSGSYTLGLLRAAPELRVTLFDLAPVVEMARARLREAGCAERVDLVAGDFSRDPLPRGHDLALLSAIIHQNDSAQNRELYANCRAALVPGGLLVIRDILMDDAHTVPAAGALFAVNMLVSTEKGGTYALAEIRADLEAAGFSEVELIRRGERMDSLIGARNPG
jgi:predicted O-methyltransferase YrrM